MRNCAAIFLLGIWLTIGAWFYVCKALGLCNNSSTTTQKELSQEPPSISVITPTLLKQAYNKIFQVEEDISFQFSTVEVETGPVFDSGIDSIATFLENNSSTKLIITGAYTNEENNTSAFSNLGLARADYIRRQLVERGVQEEQVIAISQLRDSLFTETSSSLNIIDFKFSERYEYLNESDIKSVYQAIRFLELHTKFVKNRESTVFAKNPQKPVETIQYYLNRNRSHSLLIDMPFHEAENSISDSIDIGLVRALNLKNDIRGMDIKEEDILINSHQKNLIFDEEEHSLEGVVDYNFIFPNEHDTALQRELALERALSKTLSKEVAATATQETVSKSEEPITEKSVKSSTPEKGSPLQFNSGSYTLSLNDSIFDYIEELKNYLASHPDRELLIIGHTDSVGDPEFNIELGRLRGYEARRLLINYQIAPKKIKVISEGEFSPVADNQQENGRRLNRRVDIDII